jgi:DNA-directed RNA polymerase sigma subunit (sigma70/sigma32)
VALAGGGLDPSRERRPLESYFQEIGGTRTLRREEEVHLAKDLEDATRQLRAALYVVPCSARHVVERWDNLRALSHTGAKLSEAVGDEETGEIAARVERAVKRLRNLLAEREKVGKRRRAAELERIDKRIVRDMNSAQLSLAVLVELQKKILRLARQMRRARAGSRRLQDLEADAHLPKAELLERARAVEDAHDRMTDVKNRFIEHNLKLVVAIAKDYRNLSSTI